MRSSIVSLGLLLTMLASAALAFVDPPVLVPKHPVAGETVSVSIRIGVCDAFIEKPGFPQVTRNGNSIHVLMASIHAASSDWCNFYPVATAIIPVGAYDPGSYVLQVDRTYENLFGKTIVETLGVLTFQVTGALTAKPTLHWYGLTALLLCLLCLLGLGVIALRRREGSTLLVLLLVLVPLAARSQPSESQAVGLFLADGAGTPSVQTVVDYYAAEPRSGKPPLNEVAARCSLVKPCLGEKRS